jgi:uncharacterized phage-associated protein
VANTIICLSPEQEIFDLSPMKLQKLIYYCHAWCLAFLDEPLLSDEIQAWPYGPVVADIYHEYKACADQSVSAYAKELSILNGELSLSEPFIPDADEQTLDLLRAVLRKYGHLSPIQLSNLTHQDGEPWKLIADQYPDQLPRNIVIPNELIKSCFQRMRN